jgi:hypothetical protein
MTVPSDVDLVYHDLCDAVGSLNGARESPKEVRRALSRYVELSQRLTSTMRKDFSRRGKGKWQASIFQGWTSRTDLLKHLRNQDQHGEQVFITVHDRHYYDLPDNTVIAGLPGWSFVIDSRWHMTDQTQDRPPEGIEVRLSDPGTPPDSGQVLLPTRTESSYVLYPRTPEGKQQIAASGVTDIHAFANDTFAILTQYYEYYQRAVGA